MAGKKLTKKMIIELKMDELRAVKLYKNLGLNSIAKDEKRHYNYLRRLK